MSQLFLSRSKLIPRMKRLLNVFVLGLGVSGVANASIPTFDAGNIAQLVLQYGKNELMQTLTSNSFNTQHQDMSQLKDIFGATSGGIGSMFSSIGGMMKPTILGSSKETHNDVTKGSQAAKDGLNKQELKTPAWVDDEILNSDFLKGSVSDGVYGRTGGSNITQVYNELKNTLGNCDHIVGGATLTADALKGMSGKIGTVDGSTPYNMNVSNANSGAKAKCEEQISAIVVERYLIKNALEKIRASQKALDDIYASKIGKESTVKASQDVIASIEAIRGRLKLEMAEFQNLMERVQMRNRLETQRVQMGKQRGS